MRFWRCRTTSFPPSKRHRSENVSFNHIASGLSFSQRAQLSSTACQTVREIPSPRIVLSGIQPTGVPHLGNYFGALKPWVQLQNERLDDDQLNFSIVDLHALTARPSPEKFREWRRDTYLALLAVGLDPQSCQIFFQSKIAAHSELMWILSTIASTGHLSRMTQWKTKLALPENATIQSGHAAAALKLGLFSYPVLQAADILLYKSTHVPVGEDQQQHIEFARSLANTFNSTYGDVLTIPEPIISPAKRIMSLTNPRKKMSKSDANPNSSILITDSEKTIYTKFRAALTDSENGVSYDPENRPGVSNLLDILRWTKDRPMSGTAIAAEFQCSSMKSLKEAVAHAVNLSLRDVREKFKYHQGRFEQVGFELEESQWRAEKAAARTMDEVKCVVGIA